MSTILSCAVCRYWDRFPPLQVDRKRPELGEKPSPFGLCRRHAPQVAVHTPYGESGFRVEVLWPNTSGTEWCGEGERRVEIPPDS